MQALTSGKYNKRLNFPKMVLHTMVGCQPALRHQKCCCVEQNYHRESFILKPEKRAITLSVDKRFLDRWEQGLELMLTAGVNNNNNPLVVPGMLGRNTIRVLFSPLVS